MLTLALAWLAALHRDERGTVFGDIKDLVRALAKGAADLVNWVVSSLWDAFQSIAGNVWNAAQNLRGVIWDAANVVWSVVWNAGQNLREGVWDGAVAVKDTIAWFIAVLGNRIWDGAVAVKDTIAWFLAIVGNRIWDGAVAVRDGIWSAAVHLREGVTEAGGQIAGTVDAAADKTIDSIDAAAGAVKDLPGELKNLLGPMFETAFGFGPDMFANLTDTAERFTRGEITTFEQLLDELLGAKPESTWAERTLYTILFVPAMLIAVGNLSGIIAEPMTQNYRSQHRTALLDTDDIRDAVLRGIGDEEGWILELRKQGYHDHQIDAMRQLWQELPPPSDLIRMAVREAFNDPFAELVGADLEFPEDFAFNAQRQGYSRDWAQKYWRAHWSLPSAEQGFEMFQRGEIDRAQLDALLKALDYTPFWRQPLTNIAYNVVTRVDTRRLFSAGVWDRARVEREYLNQGYNPADAAALTQWTVTAYGEDAAAGRDLTRTAIEKAYRQGRIDRAEAVARIAELGYDEDEADFLLANVDVGIEEQLAAAADSEVRELTQGAVLRAYRERIIPRGEAEALLADLGYAAEGRELLLAVQDFDVENGLANLRAKVVEQRFRKGHIAAGEARAELAGAGLGIDRADLIVQRWEAQFAERTRELTPAELERALERGVIDEPAYIDRLLSLGYTEEDALVKLALTDVAATDRGRELSAGSIVAAYKRAIISRETTKVRLTDIGFAAEDAELQLRTVDADLARAAAQRADREAAAAAAAVRELSQSTIGNAWKRGLIGEGEAVERLVALGFRAGDARLFLSTIAAAAAAPST